jgi:Dyp-type peroxidase family
MVPARTGDCSNPLRADGTPNVAHPRNWVVGRPDQPVDLLCIFAADADIEGASAELVAAIEQAGLERIYTERGEILPGDIEHFGFVDGISQPGVRGFVEIDGERRYVTTRYGVPPLDGRDYGKPGQLLADADQFLFAEDDEAPLRNGSFLVLRRLTQDVEAFHADTDRLAETLSGQFGRPISGAQLRDRIVGRQASGQPLMRPIADSAKPESALAQNHFQFAQPSPAIVLSNGEHVGASAADPDPIRGLLCPAWSHIRKVNPRDLGTDRGGPDETLGFQMLRRGIPFGPLYRHDLPQAPQNQEERGLLFLSFQTSISNQFEVLNSGWMNSLDGPAPYGHDLLVGQALVDGGHGPRTVDFHHHPDQAAGRFQALRQWVTPTGGAYLFAPGIAALRQLAG